MKKIFVFVFLTVFVMSPLFANAEHPPAPTPTSTHKEDATHQENVMTVSDDCALSGGLGLGIRSDGVSCLQSKLIKLGHLTSVSGPTGYFGKMTKEALAEWQKSKGLPMTGYFGTLSHAALMEGAHTEEGGHSEAAAPMHASLDVSSWPLVPSVSATLHEDSMSGWNLELKPTNFTFAPQNAGKAVAPNEGHAHLYIDGKKYARVYGNWFHIPKEAVSGLGEHKIRVTLNANSHSDITLGGGKIETEVTFSVKN